MDDVTYDAYGRAMQVCVVCEELVDSHGKPYDVYRCAQHQNPFRIGDVVEVKGELPEEDGKASHETKVGAILTVAGLCDSVEDAVYCRVPLEFWSGEEDDSARMRQVFFAEEITLVYRFDYSDPTEVEKFLNA